MELGRTAIRDEEVAASEETEGPAPRAPTLHDRVEVAVAGAVPPEARPPVRTAVAAVAAGADLTLVRAVAAEEALAVVAAVCHRVAAEGAAADINRSSPQAL